MKKLLLSSLFISTLNSFAQVDPVPCTDLFISEYIEGTSFNKGLEIYNPTNDTVNLSNYSIKIYFNGATGVGSTFIPAGMLLPGQTYTMINSSATIFTLFDTTISGVGSIVSFNGDDAIQLLHGTAVIDVIGIVGVDPGTNWSVSTGATSEFTLVRKSSVHNGYNVWAGSGDTTFDIYPQNTITFFGSHTIDPCPTLPVTAVFGFTANCVYDSVLFDNNSYGGDGVYTYAWDFGDGNFSSVEDPMHLFALGGCYTVQLIVTDGLGEDDTLMQLVCVIPLDDPMIVTTDSVLCNDSFGMFLVAGDTTGVWSGGPEVSNTGGGNGFFSSASITPGMYQAIYTTAGTCPNSDTVNIYIPVPPTASFTHTNVGLNYSFTNTSTGSGLTYNWSVNGVPISTATNPSYTFSSLPDTICLSVVSDSGCTAFTCEYILATGQNEINTLEQIHVFPNPSSSEVNIIAPINSIIYLRELSGKLISTFTTSKQNSIMSTIDLPEGIYSLQAGNNIVKLIIIK